ncbi:MAG: nucleotide sugar dehydrogenase [bacterium]|nr:nucleotide sugar dehydrogenase [bacterium]
MKISVIGLGKLGLPLAITIASKGFEVIGVDINKQVVNDLNKGWTHLSEPNLLSLIKKYKNNISATTEIKEAILNSEITFIIIPTPSKLNGYFSLKYVSQVIKEVGKVLKLKKSYNLVVLVSTVMPGATDKILKSLEKYSGKICGKDFGVCYNPEFIALGSVVYNLLNPDFILIGESDKKAGDFLQDFYIKYLDKKVKIARMNFVNAELTKISVNTFVTTKISYANMLSEICEKLPGGNIDKVTSALGLDLRIGEKYLTGGPSFGGPCFPRDNIAFISLAKNLKTNYYIPFATHKTNLKQIDRLVDKIFSHFKSGNVVGILGLSYKKNTDVIEESTGVNLAKSLKERNVSLNLHDPLALGNSKNILGEKNIKYFQSVQNCIKESDILVITTDWPEYKNIKKSLFKGDHKIIIDPWRMIDKNSLGKNITYLPLGLNL